MLNNIKKPCIGDAEISIMCGLAFFHPAIDSVAWRQWHHRNYIDQIARIDLKKGMQTITLHTVEIGQMNYDYINFKWVK